MDRFPVGSQLMNALMEVVRDACNQTPVLRERLFQVLRRLAHAHTPLSLPHTRAQAAAPLSLGPPLTLLLGSRRRRSTSTRRSAGTAWSPSST